MATGKRIPDLPDYGPLDPSKALKDLYEVAKNNGTYGAPDYDTGASRKVDAETMSSGLGLKRLFEKSVTYDLVFSSLTTIDSGIYKDFTITEADKGTYFKMNVAGRNYTIYNNNVAWRFVFSGLFSDGFSVAIHPNAIGGSISNITSSYMSSGKTYICTYSAANNTWTVDEMESLSDPIVSNLPLYFGTNPFLDLTNTNHKYIFDQTYAGNNKGSFFKPFRFIPANLWKGRYIDILLNSDLIANDGDLSFSVNPDTIDTIVAEGSTWIFPATCKKGSAVRFVSDGVSKISISSQVIIL